MPAVCGDQGGRCIEADIGRPRHPHAVLVPATARKAFGKLSRDGATRMADRQATFCSVQFSSAQQRKTVSQSQPTASPHACLLQSASRAGLAQTCSGSEMCCKGGRGFLVGPGCWAGCLVRHNICPARAGWAQPYHCSSAHHRGNAAHGSSPLLGMLYVSCSSIRNAWASGTSNISFSRLRGHTKEGEEARLKGRGGRKHGKPRLTS